MPLAIVVRRALVLALVLLPTACWAAHVTPTPLAFDNTHRIDANTIDMFTTNYGTWAWDVATGNPGLIFPKGSTMTAVFASGLWLGAQVNGGTRVTVAEYSQEYTTGPMSGGSFLADRPQFRTYRITRGDSTSADYLSWLSGSAHLQGAPLDSLGKPLLLGDQTLWSVYNDADPARHTNDAGHSLPLGVEVQQLTYAYSAGEALAHTVFLRFTLANKGTNVLTDAYVGLWADPDVGGANDDLAGCSASNNLGYAYNVGAPDMQYGTTPPAVGFDVLRGPVGADGHLRGMTAFTRYVNGTDPSTPIESYNYMRGLNADGTPIIDPITNMQTTYMVSGDPVTGTGWIDSPPADKRMMIASGPFNMAPGDVQEIVLAIVVGQSTDNLSAITQMRAYDLAVKAFFLGDSVTSALPRPPASSASSFRVRSIDAVAGSLRLALHLGASAAPIVRLFDPAGVLCAEYALGTLSAGDREVTLPLGAAARSGVYLAQITVGNDRATRRVIVLQ